MSISNGNNIQSGALRMVIRDGIIIVIGLLIGLFTYEHFSYGRESDAQKWERIKRNRELRRANEARFEMCATTCIEFCRGEKK